MSCLYEKQSLVNMPLTHVFMTKQKHEFWFPVCVFLLNKEEKYVDKYDVPLMGETVVPPSD